MTHATSSLQAVVVTHNPGHDVLTNLNLLLEQVSVVVVDNGSPQNSAEVLRRIELTQGVRLIRNQQNLGIGAALNIGIRNALAAGAEWIATFDQDSSVGKTYFVDLFRALKQVPSSEAVRILSPTHVVDSSQRALQTGRKEAAFDVATVITSGSVIRASTFAEAGFYDESLFIDYVDFDYCLRVKRQGYRILLIDSVPLVHHLGKLEAHRLLGFPVTIKSHRPWRRYYIMRNRFLMYRRYGLSFPGWALVDFGWLFLDLTKILLFEDQKVAKLRNVFKGIVHGLLGRTGALVAPTA